MNTLSLIGQIVGLLASAAMIISFQFKENKKLFTIQVASTLMFTLHYMLLGLGGNSTAFSGMAQNIGGFLIRIIMLLSLKYKWAKSPITMSVLCTYCAVMAAVTYTGPISLLPTVGNMIIIGAMWTGSANKIRASQLAVTSPCWLTFNVFTFSVSGIITESFNIVSIIVYYIRQTVKKRREANETEEGK